MQNFHILKVKYIGATNTLGSRVKVTSERFGQSFTFGYRHEMNSIEEMAIAELHKRTITEKTYAFHIIGTSNGYLITDTFEPLK